MLSAAILEIVASDRGDDDVFEFHSLNCFRDALRLVFFQSVRLRRGYSAESAGPGAAIPRDHHGGCSLAPAFPAIGALRTLANRMQAQIGDERLGRKKDRIRRQTDLNPGWFLALVQSRIYFRA